ncbi:MAG TPA: GntR family transcriptional regulator [Sphingobium sp.]|nr:GntR family transcriptional regulator [Sphingobium sp.]
MDTVVRKGATLQEQVADLLGQELRAGRFAPGQRLTEQGLAERLNVSRTPIREALKKMVEQGILEARQRGGYVVPSPSVEEIRQTIAVRMLLEPPAVQMAAREYDQAQWERISAAIESESAVEQDPDQSSFANANEDFRRAVFDGISNRVLLALIAQFANHLNHIRAATLKNVKLRGEIVQRQRQIRDAIVARDEHYAEMLWRSYLHLSEETLIAAMAEYIGA